jgi:hypothetical protein
MQKLVEPINFQIKDYDVTKMVIQKEFGSKRKYPFEEMKVGQGFEIKNVLRASVNGAANKYMQRHPEYVFVIARDENNNPVLLRTK